MTNDYVVDKYDDGVGGSVCCRFRGGKDDDNDDDDGGGRRSSYDFNNYQSNT